jgi:hypothetical protein
MKHQPPSPPTKSAPASSVPRQALAGIQVFSKQEDVAGPVVRHPFRTTSRKVRFFHRFYLGSLILLLFFVGREEIRAQSISIIQPFRSCSSSPETHSLRVAKSAAAQPEFKPALL